MKRLAKLIWIGALPLLTGCSVPSLNPLHTPDVVVEDKDLVGQWVNEDGSLRLTVTPDGDKVYKAFVQEVPKPSVGDAADDDEPAAMWLGLRLVQLGEHRFLSAVLHEDSREEVGERYGLMAIPVFQFARCELTADTLKTRDMDHDWIKGLLGKDPEAIAHGRLNGDMVVLTAPSKQLQEFVRKHASNDDAWQDEAVYKRTASNDK